MATLLSALNIVAKILPIIVELVKIAEQQTSESGAGSSKKDMVLGVVGIVAREFGDDLGLSPDKITSIVSKVIDVVVAFFNKTGIFKKGVQ